MKTISAFLAAFVLLACGDPAPSQPLMAWYPLNCTANDTTGQFGPMDLTNTPFAPGGGIICSGVYKHSGLPGACDAETPPMPITIFRAFALSAWFKVDSIPWKDMAIVSGGSSYRWMSAHLRKDSTVELKYNNGYGKHSALRCRPGVWHQIGLTYDSSVATGALYLDGVLACSDSFTIIHGNGEQDQTFSITNYAYSWTFKGTLRDLQIYSTPHLPTGIADPPPPEPGTIPALTNYPDPTRSGTTFQFRLDGPAHATLAVFDGLGHEVARLVDGPRPAGVQSVAWDPGRLPSGIYLARLTAGGSTSAKAVFLCR